jgi:hypothetical protein
MVKPAYNLDRQQDGHRRYDRRSVGRGCRSLPPKRVAETGQFLFATVVPNNKEFCNRNLPCPQFQPSAILQRRTTRIETEVCVPHLDASERVLGRNFPKLDTKVPSTGKAGVAIRDGTQERRPLGEVLPAYESSTYSHHNGGTIDLCVYIRTIRYKAERSVAVGVDGDAFDRRGRGRSGCEEIPLLIRVGRALLHRVTWEI